MQEIDILIKLGVRLREMRLTKGYSQEELSFLSNLDRTYISDVERGMRNVTVETLQSLAIALNVSMDYFFTENSSIFDKWDIKISELETLILENPSLRGFIIGYLAESKLKKVFENDKRISNVMKFDDHDRKNKHDLVVTYKNSDFSLEIKSLQTNTVKKIETSNIEMEARFGCDASDKRSIVLQDGSEVFTTCLRFGDFDIIAVNLFAFKYDWRFAFALNRDLPATNYKKYPEEMRKQLIKSLIPITLPLQPPFVEDPFVLLEMLYNEKLHS